MEKIGKIALLLLMCATTVGGFLCLPPAVGFQNRELARIFVFHTPCAMVGYVSAAVALWFAARYLWKRQPEDDVKSRAAMSLATVFWTLTLITGAIFAKAEWGTYWNWDIRETTVLMLWLVNLAYFALRSAITDDRKQAMLGAVYVIFATLSAPYLSYILPNSTESTLHPKGVITKPGSLGPEYYLIFWAHTLGLCLVFLWAFRLQVALGMMEWKLARRGRIPAPVVTRLQAEQGT